MLLKGTKVRLTGHQDPDNYWSSEMVDMLNANSEYLLECDTSGKEAGAQINGWFFCGSEFEAVNKNVASEEKPNDLVLARRALKALFNF